MNIRTTLIALALVLPSAFFAKEPLKMPASKSALVGTWASALCMSGTGPTDISVVTIKEDGTFHWVRIQTVPEEDSLENRDMYKPVGADLQSVENGKIDLKTGSQIITPEDRKLHVESVTWTVKGDELDWSRMIEGMGGEGVSFRKISD